MRTVWILEEAVDEAAEAAAWYEAESPGLGNDFFEALEAAIDLLEQGELPLIPMTGGAGLRDAKRIILKRFPYHLSSLKDPLRQLS